ncbi:MAG: hypothetical protein V7719_01170 [Psychroserpens sp.]|uniref:hypothetical protein n=1 Tax=Psychroserpens sp. TaxID=2020870 RepID=UPI00300174A9
MKSFRFIIFLAVISLLCACSHNDDGGSQGLNQSNSQLCNNVIGLKAEYDKLLMETYFPFHRQLLVLSQDVRDSDIDGTPDN